MREKRVFVAYMSAVLLAALAAGCKPSPEQQAKNEQRQKEYCLDHICTGDVQPKFDPKTEILFKKGGRWFVAPKEYGGYEGSLEFFWPSKTPTHKANANELAPEFVPLDKNGLSNGSAVTIQIFIESPPMDIQLSDVIKKAELEGRIHSRSAIRSELEKVEIREGGGRPDGLGTYYVAVKEKTLSGWPPIVYCDASNPIGGCGTHFLWKHGLRIYVRFNQAHGKDWPEIYSEINRVLNLIREA